jgi:hypothetical protein
MNQTSSTMLKLPMLTLSNWYQWEQLALNSITAFGHAGRAIQSNIPYSPIEPHKTLYVRFKEEHVDPATGDIEIVESTRHWDDNYDWSIYNKAMEEYRTNQAKFANDKATLWSHLLTHIDMDVDHLIKLHPNYEQAVTTCNTDKLWVILRQSVTQLGTFNASEIKIEWANYKQSMVDSTGNIISTIPLAKYLARFQGYVDNFRGHPQKPSDEECVETLLAGINSRRYSYIWHKYYWYYSN